MGNYRKEGAESAEKPWFRQFLGSFAAIPLRSGEAILVCKMVNCKKFTILQDKTEEKEQNR